MVIKAVSYRFDGAMISRLSAWSLLLKADKTTLLKEAFAQWEANRTMEERRKIDTILKELQ